MELRKLSSIVMLLAVPALALGVFAPRWQTASASTIDTTASLSIPLQDLTQSNIIELSDFADTYNPTPAEQAALAAKLKTDLISYTAMRNAKYKAILARYKAKYRGATLKHYQLLAYKNLSIENINFQQFEKSKTVALYRDGVVSASTYKFVALK